MGAGGSSALGPPGYVPCGRGGLLRFRTTEAPAAWTRGPPSFWDHRGPRRMGAGPSCALGPPGYLPCGRGGVLRFRTTEVPAAWASGSCSALWPPRPPPHGRGGLLRFGTGEAPMAWARGPPPLWDHRWPRRMGEGASSALGPLRPTPHGRGFSSALGPLRPSPHGRGGLLHFRTTEAPAAWVSGRLPLWDHRVPPPHWRGGLLRFQTTEAPVAWALGRLPPGDHRGPCRMDTGRCLVLRHRGTRHLGAWAPSALGPPGYLPRGRGGLLCFRTTEAPAAWASGSCSAL